MRQGCLKDRGRGRVETPVLAPRAPETGDQEHGMQELKASGSGQCFPCPSPLYRSRVSASEGVKVLGWERPRVPWAGDLTPGLVWVTLALAWAAASASAEWTQALSLP